MENTLIHADIFFFVSTIAVVVITILVSIAAVYIIKLVKDVRRIAELVYEEADEIMDDVDQFRRKIKGRAGKLSALLGVVTTSRFLRKVYKLLKRDK